jgi:hypothetical protein
LEHIAIPDYDAFALSGLGFDVNRVVHIYATHRTEAISPAGGPHQVSQQCFEAAAREYIAASLAIALANKIISISNAPVFVLPSPRRGAGFRKRGFQSLYAAEHVDAPALGATFEDIY